jgi:hypothetical protein
MMDITNPVEDRTFPAPITRVIEESEPDKIHFKITSIGQVAV